MIVKLCKVGSTPRRLMAYLGRAARPNASLLDGNIPGSSAAEWAGWVSQVNNTYRPQKNQFVKHFVLSYATGEHRPEDEMREAARFFLQRMGYAEAPYVAFLHKDTDNDHIHIVTTPTTWEGKEISERFDKLRCVRIAREIGERWHLVQVTAPEAAFLKSPTQGEMKSAVRGEESRRAAFQVEVAQAARDSHTFVEFLVKLEAGGFTSRVLLDKEGQVRGISFARGGVAFKGSQLGRAFRAGNLFSTFQLAYDPERDRTEVLRLAGREAPLGGGQALAEPESRSLRETLRREPDGAEDLRQLEHRPDLPARQLVSLDWLRGGRVMPDGTYIVLPLSQKEVAAGLERIEARPLKTPRREQTLQQALAEGQRAEHAGAAAILARRLSGDRSRMVGLRDLSVEQVVTLRREGFEPAVLVRVGERYDLWLRPHERLSEREEWALRQELADRYGIATPKGTFLDGIRLPGSSFERSGQRFRVRLVEVREEPFSASRLWLAELRGEGREDLHERVRRLDTPQLEAPLARAETVPYPGLADFPSPSRLSGIEAHFALQGRRPPRDDGHSRPQDPVEQLIARAHRINQEAIREELTWAPGRPHEAGDRLRAVEGELAGRLRQARQSFESAREKMVSAWQRVETAATTVEAAPSLERIYGYQVIARSYGLARTELEQAEHTYSQLALAQLSLHRERFGWALTERERPVTTWNAYERLLCREARLEIQLGLPTPSGFDGSASGPQIRDHLRVLEARLSSLRSEGAFADRWPEVEEILRARATAALLLERSEARETWPDPGQRLRDLARPEPQEAFRGYGHWRIEVSERASVEEALAVQAATAPERLRETVERVAAGDLSPEALRRLNAALLTEIPAHQITLPVLSPGPEPRDGLGELARLAPEILQGAQRLARSERLSPEDAARLFGASAEAVTWLRQLDRAQRSAQGIPEPGRPPREVSELPWRAAWVEIASERGLPPQAAASHLGNLGRTSLEGAPRAFDIALSWALSLGRSLAWRTGRWLRDVLTDGEERRIRLHR